MASCKRTAGNLTIKLPLVAMSNAWAVGRTYAVSSLRLAVTTANAPSANSDWIQQIYAYERTTADYSAEQRKTYREEHLRPLFEQFKNWLDEQNIYLTPKSPIAKAFTYVQNQWPTLVTIFADGRLLIDNNHIENKIRPLALGPKNYLFAGAHQAAKRAAIMYSFMASCKEYNINPYQWIHDTLSRIADTKMPQLAVLLPVKGWKSRGQEL